MVCTVYCIISNSKFSRIQKSPTTQLPLVSSCPQYCLLHSVILLWKKAPSFTIMVDFGLCMSALIWFNYFFQKTFHLLRVNAWRLIRQGSCAHQHLHLFIHVKEDLKSCAAKSRKKLKN